MTMNLPEYLVLFSNKGTIDVHVKFEKNAGKIVVQKMEPREISALISDESMGFYKQMTFDDHKFAVCKYEIDPQNDRLTIVVKEIS